MRVFLRHILGIIGIMVAEMAFFSPGLHAESDLIVNGSFEEGTFELPPTHTYSEQIREGGWVVDDPLLQPVGWCITPVPQFVGEFHLIDNPQQSHTGQRCILLKGHLIHENSLEVQGGDDLIITFWARSNNLSKASIKVYLYGTDDAGEPAWLDEIKETEIFSVGADWEKYVSKVKLPKLINGQKITSAKIVLFSDTGSYFDDVTLDSPSPSKG